MLEPSDSLAPSAGTSAELSGVRISGALTLSAVLEQLPFEIFRRAKKDSLDEYQLGWRLILPRQPLMMNFRRVRFATAEGCNLVAILHDLLDGGKETRLLKLSFDEESTGLSRVLQNIKHLSTLPATHFDLNRISAQARGVVCIYDVGHPDQVLAAARHIAESATRSAAADSSDERSNFYDMTERVAVEALFNIYEHAFSFDHDRKRAFVSLTLQPAARCIDNGSRQPVEERQWLENQGQGMIVELAITDVGNGIPKTLWRSAKDQRPQLFNALSTLNSGMTAFDTERAVLHARLAADSFRHDSTCKAYTDFADEYHALNWRGLYRCRQQIAEFGGFIAVASGRGRAGFAWTKESTTMEFSHSFAKRNDLPGTTVLVRLALPLQRRVTRNIAQENEADAGKTATIFTPYLLSWKDLTVARPGQRIVKRSNGKTPIVAIAFPFRKISSHHHLLEVSGSSIPVPYVLRMLSHIPPDVVPVFAFADAEGTTLRTIAPTWTALHGYPRLVAIFAPHQKQLAWRVAGVFHTDTEEMLFRLETTGRYEIPKHAPATVGSLARELSLNYPLFITFDSDQHLVLLTHFNARISDESIRLALEKAFIDFWPEIRSRVIKEDPQRPVLLHTGTRVRRYLCVLSLVESSRLLADVLGRQLMACVEPEKNGRKCKLVTDDYGSSYVAQTLLRDVASKITPIRRDEALSLARGSEVVLFVDAIFKGRTVTNLAEVLRARELSVRAIVTCADLRDVPGSRIGKHIKVTSLLTIPADFRPEDLGEGSDGGDEVQIDRVTHMPVDAEASRFVDLHTTQSALELLDRGPNLFEHGFHERGGRLHTIALPADRILRDHTAEIIRCLTDKLSPFLRDYADTKTDIAFCYRSGSAVGRYIGHLYEELLSRSLIKWRHVFRLEMPAGHTGARSVFVHPDVGLFTSAKPVEVGQLSLAVGAEHQYPNQEFIAIYIDDAAVSGKALRSFLYHVMRDPERQPRAVMGLVIVNRLSPDEVRAFDFWQKLWPTTAHGASAGIPFRFDSVFRLQVGSSDGGFALSHPLFQRIQQSGPIPTPEMRLYIQQIGERLANERPLRHIFLTEGPDPGRPFSSDAARLRHLLAIHQQNEAVPAQILSTFTRMREAKDPALLHVLALEPKLLDEVPFNGICFRDTIEFCVETLKDQAAARADKSDALCVLAWYETAFFDRLREIAPGVLADQALRQQFLLFVLTLFTRSKEQYHRVIDALGDVTAPAEQKGWANWAAQVVTRSHRFRQTLALVQSDADAEMLVRELIMRMSRHSTDAEWHWESLSNRLITMREDWSAFGYKEAREKVLNSVPLARALAQDVFLPALSALVYLSELRGDNTLAERMGKSHGLALLALERLTEISPSRLEDVTPARVIELCEALEALRDVTWAGNWSANDVLSLSTLGANPPPLCQALREFYSAPWAIFGRLADELRAEIGLTGGATNIEPSIIVCPVPVADMHLILTLLLDNVRKHGEPSSLMGTKLDGEPPLIISFQNRVRSAEMIGGFGITLARARATRFGIDVVSESDTATSGGWITKITFPTFFRADPSLI